MPNTETYSLRFPNASGEAQEINISKGSIWFILGANGTGKSGLMHRLYSQNSSNAKRISAHRQTWFTSNAMDFTSSNKVTTETHIHQHDNKIQSRWRDDYSQQRSQVIVFDLINAQNIRARKIADAMDANEVDLAMALSEKDAPLKVLNYLLHLSNLPIEISIGNDEKVFASKNGSDLYSIAELSDGERNAILIAANVLTAPENTLFVIDEPERHLHRSIISPLLTSLFQNRDDCTFVVATHDIGLPLDNPESSVLLVRNCQWNRGNILGWDTDLISSADEIDYQIKQDILGARRTLLFVEGTGNSLDLHLYRILFPEVSVIPQGNCNDVERAVYGISTTNSLHWVRAFGLVDSDDRQTEDINNLKRNNIYALPCYSVESIYYCPEILESLASKSAELHGGDPTEMITSAIEAIVTSVANHKDRLCARLCERKVKQQIVPPDWKKIRDEANFSINLNLEELLADEKLYFDRCVNEKDIEQIISRYPVRETQVLNEIARVLNFSSRANYESAVRKLLTDDEDIRNQIKNKFGDLVLALEGNSDLDTQEDGVAA